MLPSNRRAVLGVCVIDYPLGTKTTMIVALSSSAYQGPISPNRLLCDYYGSGPIKAPINARSALIGFPITYYEGGTTTWCYLSRPGYHHCHDSGPIKAPMSARSALIGFPITYIL